MAFSTMIAVNQNILHTDATRIDTRNQSFVHTDAIRDDARTMVAVNQNNLHTVARDDTRNQSFVHKDAIRDDTRNQNVLHKDATRDDTRNQSFVHKDATRHDTRNQNILHKDFTRDDARSTPLPDIVAGHSLEGHNTVVYQRQGSSSPSDYRLVISLNRSVSLFQEQNDCDDEGKEVDERVEQRDCRRQRNPQSGASILSQHCQYQNEETRREEIGSEDVLEQARLPKQESLPLNDNAINQGRVKENCEEIDGSRESNQESLHTDRQTTSSVHLQQRLRTASSSTASTIATATGERSAHLAGLSRQSQQCSHAEPSTPSPLSPARPSATTTAVPEITTTTTMTTAELSSQLTPLRDPLQSEQDPPQTDAHPVSPPPYSSILPRPRTRRCPPCLTALLTLQWFLPTLAIVGMLNVLMGTLLMCLHDVFLSSAIVLMIFGVTLIGAAGVTYVFSPLGSEPLLRLCNIIYPAGRGRRRSVLGLSRPLEEYLNGRVVHPDFLRRPPPPSYDASMRAYECSVQTASGVEVQDSGDSIHSNRSLMHTGRAIVQVHEHHPYTSNRDDDDIIAATYTTSINSNDRDAVVNESVNGNSTVTTTSNNNNVVNDSNVITLTTDNDGDTTTAIGFNGTGENGQHPPGSPPPSYRSHASNARPSVYTIFSPQRQVPVPGSPPPSYRLRPDYPRRPSFPYLFSPRRGRTGSSRPREFPSSSLVVAVSPLNTAQARSASGFCTPMVMVDMSSSRRTVAEVTNRIHGHRRGPNSHSRRVHANVVSANSPRRTPSPVSRTDHHHHSPRRNDNLRGATMQNSFVVGTFIRSPRATSTPRVVRVPISRSRYTESSRRRLTTTVLSGHGVTTGVAERRSPRRVTDSVSTPHPQTRHQLQQRRLRDVVGPL